MATYRTTSIFARRTSCVRILLAAALSLLSYPQTHCLAADEKKPVVTGPESLSLRVVPVLKPGEKAQAMVLDANLAPRAGAQVTVAGTAYTSDAGGSFVFDVPDSSIIEIKTGDTNNADSHKTFVRKGSLLVLEGLETIGSLVNTLNAEAKGRRSQQLAYLDWAPAVLLPDHDFILLGEGFEALAGKEHLLLDGREVPIVSSSPRCILAHLPAGTQIGPVKDLFVEVDGKASNQVELDVCETFIDWPTEIDPDGAPKDGTVGVKGTNMPAGLLVTNNSMDHISIWLPDKNPLGRVGRVVTPGGDRNWVTLGFLWNKTGRPDFVVELMSELSLEPEGKSNQNSLRLALARAQVMRINRRLITVRSQIDECRSLVERDSKNDTAQAELRALSSRKTTLSQMLSARKTMFASLGGTGDDYLKALDEAAGGAFWQVDAQAGAVVAAPGSRLATAITSEGAVKRQRARLHRLVEPAIKLLPPMTDAELAAKPANIPESTPRVTTPGGLRDTLPEDEALRDSLQRTQKSPEDKAAAAAAEKGKGEPAVKKPAEKSPGKSAAKATKEKSTSKGKTRKAQAAPAPVNSARHHGRRRRHR